MTSAHEEVLAQINGYFENQEEFIIIFDNFESSALVLIQIYRYLIQRRIRHCERMQSMVHIYNRRKFKNNILTILCTNVLSTNKKTKIFINFLIAYEISIAASRS